MANTYKNIVITPNRDTDAANVPVIRFSGGDATLNTDINLRVYTTQSGTLSFEGSAGQLFSITNDLTNSIFSVNDVSGIPSIEVLANGSIFLAPFGGNVSIDGTTLFVDSVGNRVLMGNASSNIVFQHVSTNPYMIMRNSSNSMSLAYQANNRLSTIGSITGQELLSVIDSFTGTIFSVTTSDGVPLIEVTNDGLVELAQYFGNVYIGANNTTNTFLAVGNTSYVYSSNISTGGLSLGITTKTSNYSVQIGDKTILANAQTSPIVITLPAANTNVGKTYSVKKIDISSNTVTVNTTFSQTIDGAATVNLNSQYATLSFQSDGSNWWIV